MHLRIQIPGQNCELELHVYAWFEYMEFQLSGYQRLYIFFFDTIILIGKQTIYESK